ncbi:DUF72 domain-containing protein [Propylenella binzhouense]|uniref:DUF72 domain-containing protein n=1 Tax=Propylenella binzhouense TaxID=2555902 RepID=A0A964T6C3_9HYPH|nr:DUF72 domain-containing protein [Propylenella binzhouense]MYZ48722.1 DUF72 domain-containing protein [Propylenella binzhouense]
MANGDEARIRVGIGGWNFGPWRGTFYPKGLPARRELEFASRNLTSIEVNGTFYRSQAPETFAKWREETPDDFVFALKGPRYATNRRNLAEAGESIERFCSGGPLALGEKLGPINWQLMPAKAFDRGEIEAFLKLLPKSVEGRPMRHAIEVRHESFRTPDFVALAREYGVAIVLAGDCDYPQIGDLTAGFVYARIMGTCAEEPAGYGAEALDGWAERARLWAAGGAPEDIATVETERRCGPARDVFLYVISGEKAKNPSAAMALRERLERG